MTRKANIIKLYLDGNGLVSLSSIAKQKGVTRQYVSVVLRDAGYEPKKVYESRVNMRKADAERMRKEEELVFQNAQEAYVAEAPKCKVCERPILRQMTRKKKMQTCSDECAKLWVVVRYHLDEEASNKHRITQAYTVLRNPGRYNASMIANSKRIKALVEAGEPLPPRNRTFIVPGSATAKALERVQELREANA